jgi:diguanylate cyclase (GGDEF)-like protein
MQITVLARGLALVALACASLIAVDGWRSWNARSTALVQAEESTSNVSSAASQQANDTLREVETSLDDVVERVEKDGMGINSRARLHNVLVRKSTQLPQVDGIFLSDANGLWITDSELVTRRAPVNADQDYFRYAKTNDTKRLFIGIPYRSAVDNKWVIPLSLRLNNADGSFAGVVVAPLDIEFLLRFYQGFELGKCGSISLTLENGIRLVRRPRDAGGIGNNMLNTELFTAYLSNGSTGSAQVRSPTDGVTRVFKFRRLADYPVFVAAAMSKNEILKSWFSDTLTHLAGVACLILIISACGWRLIQVSNRSEREIRSAHDRLEKANWRLEILAFQDGLTSLANRRQFDQTLEAEFARAARHGSSIALIMMDLDFFKQYNDIYGHAAGDACLRTVSQVIGNPVRRRPGDLSARYGGEELVMLLPETYLGGACAVAESIRHAIVTLDMEHAGNPRGVVTISAGVSALIPQQGDKPEDLIRAADQALYEAKKAGRNQIRQSP